MQHNVKLDNFPFRGSFFLNKKSSIQQLLQNNHKNGSRPKDFDKNIYTSNNIDPLRATISCTLPKVNLVQFEDPYDHINPMENTHEYTNLIDTQEQ